MKKNKLATGLSLTILVALLGGGVAQAVSAVSPTQAPNTAPVKTQHSKGAIDPVITQNQRQNMPLSARKAAAARLKVAYTKARANHKAGGVK